MDINIRPEVNILGVLRHLNYKPWFALAEFVDNSIASALQNGLAEPGNPVRVTIDLNTEDGGRIIVRDDAGGIKPHDFPRAFRAAQLPPDRSGLSEFGMGMKSAATWFAHEWRVTTSVAGDPLERSVNFDMDHIRNSGLDTLEVRETPCTAESHFTTIELLRLNHIPQTKTLSKIKTHLTSIYRSFLREKRLQLVFRDEELAFDEVSPLVSPPVGDLDGPSLRWLKEIDFRLDDAHRVHGFAGLRSKGSTADAGFALFRRGRLIMGSTDETYRPVEVFGRSTTHTYQRLYGELTLEGFEVSHTKDGFRWDDLEEPFLAELKKALSAGEMDLLKQAANYRLQPIRDNRLPVETAVTSISTEVEDRFDGPAARELSQPPESDIPIPDSLPHIPSNSPISRITRVALEDEVWVVELEATLEDGIPDWIAVGAEVTDKAAHGDLPETRVKVTVSLAHPFSRRFLGPSNENAEAIVSFAALVGLALALGKRSGAKSQSIVRRINELSRETFAGAFSPEGRS